MGWRALDLLWKVMGLSVSRSGCVFRSASIWREYDVALCLLFLCSTSSVLTFVRRDGSLACMNTASRENKHHLHVSDVQQEMVVTSGPASSVADRQSSCCCNRLQHSGAYTRTFSRRGHLGHEICGYSVHSVDVAFCIARLGQVLSWLPIYRDAFF